MATRAAIAKRREGGWTGVYHHWDGYPTCLGAHLWDLLHNRYAGNMGRLVADVIDAHPGGWSHLMDGNICKPVPGGQALTTEVIGHGPACYCHTYAAADYGDNVIHGCECSDPAITEPSCDPLFIEWVYVFDTDRNILEVLTSVATYTRPNGKTGYQHWPVATIPGHIKDVLWDQIEAAGRAIKESFWNLKAQECASR
jgi:hypothetical protein